MHLQGPSESVPTWTFSRCFVAGSSSPTLAPLQTPIPKAPCRTRVLTVATYEPWRTLTGSLDWITERSVLTLTLLSAGRPPVFVVTGWKVTQQDWLFNPCKTMLRFSVNVTWLVILLQLLRLLDLVKSILLIWKDLSKENETPAHKSTFPDIWKPLYFCDFPVQPLLRQLISDTHLHHRGSHFHLPHFPTIQTIQLPVIIPATLNTESNLHSSTGNTIKTCEITHHYKNLHASVSLFFSLDPICETPGGCTLRVTNDVVKNK